MRTFAWKEHDDRRVFGAVRFIHAVDASPISGPLELTAAPAAPGGAPPLKPFFPLRIVRNRLGLHVIHAGVALGDTDVTKELNAYTEQFAPTPPKPAPETLTARLRVADPSGHFLPTEFSLALPRNPAGRDPLHSVAAPLEVRLYPSPAAPVASSWAPLRVMVWRLVAAPTAGNPQATRPEPLRGALVRALSLADASLLGSGLTEWRRRADGAPASCAEALVALRDILVIKWGTTDDGPVFTDTQQVQLEVRFDPAFKPDEAHASPNLADLEKPAASVVTGQLAAAFAIRARQQVVRHVAFNPANALAEFTPP